jgi:isopentenyl-diphosphate delta-isomerase type 2
MNTTPQSDSSAEKRSTENRAAGENLGMRKQAHIDICTDPALPVEGGRSMFDAVSFLHRSLPEINAGDIDSGADFLGYRLSAPVLISCMTGGSDEGYRLNRILAEAAENLGFAVGTGSLRILLNRPEVTDHFRLKDLAPNVPVIGNIGAVQLPQLLSDGGAELDRFLSILNDLNLDALAIHLNPGQELFQQHGDRNFAGLLDAIAELCRISSLPIIAKETGAGVNPAEARALLEAGVRYVDIAGAGGTNWMSVEALRENPGRLDDLLGDFADWGLPSAVALSAALEPAAIRSPATPASSPPAACAGLGISPKPWLWGPPLRGPPCRLSGRRRMAAWRAPWHTATPFARGIRTAMLLTGVADLESFRAVPLMYAPQFLGRAGCDARSGGGYQPRHDE